MDELCSVVSLEWRTSKVFELTVERNGVEFTPGDSFAIFAGDGNESRPYSVASGTDEPTLRFLIQQLPDGIVSNYLSELRPGDKIRLSEPFGWFHPGKNTSDEPLVFIATGTGIAPFLSYLRAYPDKGPVVCLYGVRYFEDALDLDFLKSSCDVRLVISREDGHIYHKGRVTDLLPSLDLLAGTHFYLCGLDAMIDDVSAWLEGTGGIDFSHIHREVFFHAPS